LIRYRSYTPGKSKLAFPIAASKIYFQPMRHKGRRVLDLEISQRRFRSVAPKFSAPTVQSAPAKYLKPNLFIRLNLTSLFQHPFALSLSKGLLTVHVVRQAHHERPNEQSGLKSRFPITKQEMQA